MAHSKGGNGVNIADEFTAGKVSALPKSERPGRQATPLVDGILSQVRDILLGDDGAVFGKTLYTATADELTAYNKEATENGRPPVTLDTLARRFAFNGCSGIKR